MKVREAKARYKLSTKRQAPERLSVRLKPELAERLDQARQTCGESVSSIVEQALTEYLDRNAPPRRVPLLEALRKNGILGALDLGPHASRDYKELVAQSVAEKYGHR